MRRWNWRAIALLAIAALVVWFIAGVVLAGREPSSSTAQFSTAHVARRPCIG